MKLHRTLHASVDLFTATLQKMMAAIIERYFCDRNKDIQVSLKHS